jgi:IS30 family transposase
MLTVDQNQCKITMPETYTYLTEEQRYQIYEGLIDKLSHREIAQKIRKHHSCMSREISRNKGLKGYRPRQAQSFAEQRKEEKPRYIKLTLKVQAVIKKNIGRTRIDERPAVVDSKERLGDWEADTVIEKGHKGVLVTLAERCSRKTLIAHVKSKHAEVASDAIIRLLKDEKEKLHTITFDNGKEFAYHAKIKNALACDNYFAHPYCSWERGLNENHNGLIRQYLPKGMVLDKVTRKK